MAKVIFAKDYGNRVVVRVTTNPDDLEWVHVVGEPVMDATGQPTAKKVAKATPDHAKSETGETCHNCRYNWNVREFVWTGDQLLKEDADGKSVRKTDAELMTEVTERLVIAPTPPKELAGLMGKAI